MEAAANAHTPLRKPQCGTRVSNNAQRVCESVYICARVLGAPHAALAVGPLTVGSAPESKAVLRYLPCFKLRPTGSTATATMRAFIIILHSIEFIIFLHTSLFIPNAALENAETGPISVVSAALGAALFRPDRAYFSRQHTDKNALKTPAASFTSRPRKSALCLYSEPSIAAAARAAPGSAASFLPCESVLRYSSFPAPVRFSDFSSAAERTTAVGFTALPPSTTSPPPSKSPPLPASPILLSRRLSGLPAAPKGIATLPPRPAAFAGAFSPFSNPSASSPLVTAYLAGVPRDSLFFPAFDTASAPSSSLPVTPYPTFGPRAITGQHPPGSALPAAGSFSFPSAPENQLPPSLPFNAFLPPNPTHPSGHPANAALIYDPVPEAPTLSSSRISKDSTKTQDHLATVLDEGSYAIATGSMFSYPEESYPPAAMKSFPPLNAENSSAVVSPGDSFLVSAKDRDIYVGNAALSDSKTPSLSPPTGASPYFLPTPVSGDHVRDGLAVPDVVGTAAAAEPAPVRKQGTPEAMQQEQQQEEGLQLLASVEAATEMGTFACCSGTWYRPPGLERTPAINIGGPILAGKYNEDTRAPLLDEDQTFLDQFAKAKEEFYSTYARNGRGSPRTHQGRSTSTPQQHSKKLPITSLTTATAHPAAALHPSTSGRLKRATFASTNVVTLASGGTPVISAAAEKVAAPNMTNVESVPEVERIAASIGEADASVHERDIPTPESHLRQHLSAGMRTGGEYSASVLSNNTNNPRIGARNTSETGQVISNSAVAEKLGRNAVRKTKTSGIAGTTEPHTNNAEAQSRTHAVSGTTSNNALAKASRNRAEIDSSSGTAALKIEKMTSSLSPDTGRARTRGQQEEYCPYAKTEGPKESRKDAGKRSGDPQPSKPNSSSVAGPLRRHSRSADGVAQHRSKERKDRRFFCASGGTRRATVPSAPPDAAAELAPAGTATAVPTATAASGAAVGPTSAVPAVSPIPPALAAPASVTTGQAEELRTARARQEALLRTRATPAFTSTETTPKGVGVLTRASETPIAPSESIITALPAFPATPGRGTNTLLLTAGRGPSQPLLTAAVAKSTARVSAAAAKQASRERCGKVEVEPLRPAQVAHAGTSILTARRDSTQAIAKASPQRSRAGGRAAGSPVAVSSAAKRTQIGRIAEESSTAAEITLAVAGNQTAITNPQRSPVSLPAARGGGKEGDTAATIGHGSNHGPDKGGHVAARSRPQTSISLFHRRTLAAV